MILNSDKIIQDLPIGNSAKEFYCEDFCACGSFGVRVSPKGRRSFFYLAKVSGKRKRITLGRFPHLNLSRALAQAYQLAARVESGADPIAEEKFYRDIPRFKDLALQMLEVEKLSERTKKEYLRIFARELFPIWGNIKLSQLEDAEVERLYKHISVYRGSNKMAERVISLLSRFFKYAKKNGLVIRIPNFSRLIETDVQESISMSSRRFLTEAELRSLFIALEEESLEIRSVYKLILYLGQRPQDITSLRWSEIRGEQWRAKKTSREALWLAPQVRSILSELAEEVGGEEFVFENSRGKALQYIRRSAKRIGQRMNSSSLWSPISLQYTVEHELYKLGAPLEVLANIVGRSTELRRLRRFRPMEDLNRDTKRFLSLWATKLYSLSQSSPSPSPFSAQEKPRASSNVVMLFD